MKDMFNMFSEPGKTDIKLKEYPTYTLFGRIEKKNVPEFEKTNNENLILYRFCINGTQNVKEYKEALSRKRGQALRW